MSYTISETDIFHDIEKRDQTPYVEEEAWCQAKVDPLGEFYVTGDKSTSLSNENRAELERIPVLENENWSSMINSIEKPHQYQSGESNYSSEPLTLEELFGTPCIFGTEECNCHDNNSDSEDQISKDNESKMNQKSKQITKDKDKYIKPTPVRPVKTPVNRTKKNIKNSMKNLTIDSCHSLESHIYRGLVEAICKKTGCVTQKFLMFAETLRLNMKQFGFPVMRKLWAGSAMRIDESTLKIKSALRGFEKDFPVLGEAYLSWMKIYLKKIAVQRTYRSKVRGSGDSMVASYQHMSRCMRDINLLTRHVPLLSNWN